MLSNQQLVSGDSPPCLPAQSISSQRLVILALSQHGVDNEVVVRHCYEDNAYVCVLI